MPGLSERWGLVGHYSNNNGPSCQAPCSGGEPWALPAPHYPGTLQLKRALPTPPSFPTVILDSSWFSLSAEPRQNKPSKSTPSIWLRQLLAGRFAPRLRSHDCHSPTAAHSPPSCLLTSLLLFSSLLTVDFLIAEASCSVNVAVVAVFLCATDNAPIRPTRLCLLPYEHEHLAPYDCICIHSLQQSDLGRHTRYSPLLPLLDQITKLFETFLPHSRVLSPAKSLIRRFVLCVFGPAHE
jgi:hypothetical protein